MSRKPAYRTMDVVAVEIADPDHRGAPDDGITVRFMAWALKNEIFTAVSAGYSGPNGLLGFYSPTDAAKIREWLDANGASRAEWLHR